MREEVIDKLGNGVYLTDERWQHIVSEHSKLRGCRNEVLSAVRSGKRKQDQWFLDKFYYNKKFLTAQGRIKEIEVVVIFRWKVNTPNNFILTAYQL